MKSSLLIASLLALPFTPALAASDPCARFPTDKPNPLLHKASFQNDAVQAALQFTREERVDITCQIKSAVLRSYSAIALKKERIGLDAEAHLNGCVEAEAKLKESTRLKFLDRIQKCIAAFQDTHFQARANLRPPGVVTAVGLGWIDGKVRITSRYKKLMQWIEAKEDIKLAAALPPGAEVLEIDGVPTEAWMEELMPYIGASSPAARRNWAASALLARNFVYPVKNTVDLKVLLPDGKESNVRLPWFSTKSGNATTDGLAELKRIGIQPTALASWSYNELLGRWEASTIEREGIDLTMPLVDPASLKEYKDDDGEIAFRAGEVMLDRKHVFCYVQLLTFDTEKLSRESKAAPFLEVLGETFAGCEAKQLPLLFDLRSNPGGVSSYPAGVMALLTPRGQKSSADVRALRANSQVAWMLSQGEDSSKTGARLLDSKEMFESYFYATAEALRRGEAHTNVMVSGDLSPALSSGFNQAIVALITPDCVSACDMMAALLKANNRAILVGSHTNGTGAGMMRIDALSNAFQDSYQMFRFGIPITLFGAAGKTGLSSQLPFSEGKELILENRPTVAHLPYETTMQDLPTGRGWLKTGLAALMKADEELNKK